jgi:hypothetical protein
MSEPTQLLAQRKQHGPRLAGSAIHYNKEGCLCFRHLGLLQEAHGNGFLGGVDLACFCCLGTAMSASPEIKEVELSRARQFCETSRLRTADRHVPGLRLRAIRGAFGRVALSVMSWLNPRRPSLFVLSYFARQRIPKLTSYETFWRWHWGSSETTIEPARKNEKRHNHKRPHWKRANAVHAYATFAARHHFQNAGHARAARA